MVAHRAQRSRVSRWANASRLARSDRTRHRVAGVHLHSVGLLLPRRHRPYNRRWMARGDGPRPRGGQGGSRAGRWPLPRPDPRPPRRGARPSLATEWRGYIFTVWGSSFQEGTDPITDAGWRSPTL